MSHLKQQKNPPKTALLREPTTPSKRTSAKKGHLTSEKQPMHMTTQGFNINSVAQNQGDDSERKCRTVHKHTQHS